MTVAGMVAIISGIVASSIALVGFGLDSAVEGFASTIIIWRFTGLRVFSKRAEHRAQKLVAFQFFMLPRTSASSPSGRSSVASTRMSALSGWSSPAGVWPRRCSAWPSSGSPTRSAPPPPRARAARTLDPVVGLLIAGVTVKEGAEAQRREGCCVGSPLDGYAVPRDACADDCCSDD